MFTFDLRATYHHIKILQGRMDHWTEKGIPKYYVSHVLAFGLSTAGYLYDGFANSYSLGEQRLKSNRFPG